MFNKKLLFKNPKSENPYIKFKMYPSFLYREASYQSHVGYFDKTGTSDENSINFSRSFFGSSGQLIDYDSNTNYNLTSAYFECSTDYYIQSKNDPYMRIIFYIENVTDKLLNTIVSIKFGEYEEYITTYKNIYGENWYKCDLSNATILNLYKYFRWESIDKKFVKDGISYGGTWYEPSPEILLTFYP